MALRCIRVPGAERSREGEGATLSVPSLRVLVEHDGIHGLTDDCGHGHVTGPGDAQQPLVLFRREGDLGADHPAMIPLRRVMM